MIVDWSVSLALAAAVMWWCDRWRQVGLLAVVVGAVAMMALAAVVGVLLASVRPIGAVVGMLAVSVVCEVFKAMRARS